MVPSSENNFIKAKKAPTIQLLLNEVIIPLNIKEIDSKIILFKQKITSVRQMEN